MLQKMLRRRIDLLTSTTLSKKLAGRRKGRLIRSNLVSKQNLLYLFVFISIFYCLVRELRFGLDGTTEYGLHDLVDPASVRSKSSSRSSRTGLECRVFWDYEKKTNLIDRWVELDLPILTSVVRDDRAKKEVLEREKKFYKNLKQDIVYITLTHAHGKRGKNVAMNFKNILWKCIYGRRLSENGRTHHQIVYHEFAEHVQSKKPLDIINLMCNHTKNGDDWVLKGISPTKLPDLKAAKLNTTNITSFVYSLEKPLECDRLEQEESAAIHNPKKIGACVRFMGDKDRSLIPQFIEYHRILGIEHFWIFINEDWNLTGLYNASYITYMPLDFICENHKSHFNHIYYSMQPEISQEPANNHCLWNAKKYGYDWVTTTDVDEWIHIPAGDSKADQNVSTIFPLRSYLKRFDPNTFSCLSMKSVPFGSNQWLHKPDFSPNPLLIDYTWRENKTFSKFSHRKKVIYNPQNVWGIGVHHCWTAQGIHTHLHPAKDAYVHHYKRPDKGVFLKMEKMMVKSEESLLRDSIMRDMYRSDLVSALEEVGHLEGPSGNN